MSGPSLNARSPLPPAIEGTLTKGIAARNAGRPTEALELFERALAEGAPAGEVELQIAQTLYGAQRFEEAATVYRKLLDRRPDDLTARIGLARSLDKEMRWVEAAEEFRAVLRLDAARIEAKLALGICLLHLKQPAEALALFESRLSEDSEDRIALFGKGVALHLSGRADELAEIYSYLVGCDPLMAQAFASFGILKPAEPAVRKRPAATIRDALRGLIADAFASNDHQAAERHCSDLTALSPDCFEAWFNLGVARQRQGHVGEAAAAYEQAVRLAPESAQAQLGLAVARHGCGDLEGAIERYETALRADGDLEVALWNLGLLREDQRDMAGAEELYGRLVEVTPSSPDAWFRLGYVRFDRGDFRGSIKAYERCLELRPDWLEVAYNLGLAQWRAGEHEAAECSFKKGLEAPSAPDPVWRALAALALECGDTAAALKWHLELIRRGDRTVDILYNAALLQHRAGNLDAAVQSYEQVLELAPEFCEALLNLGLAQKAAGDSLTAMISCQKAIRLQPELADKYFDYLGWVDQHAGSAPA